MKISKQTLIINTHLLLNNFGHCVTLRAFSHTPVKLEPGALLLNVVVHNMAGTANVPTCSCLLVVRGAARLFLKPCRSRSGTGLVQKQRPMLLDVHVHKSSDLLETALAQCYSAAFDSLSVGLLVIYGKS